MLMVFKETEESQSFYLSVKRFHSDGGRALGCTAIVGEAHIPKKFFGSAACSPHA